MWSVPRIHPTSQLCQSPLRLPKKHRMPRPAPQHGLNIQPPLSPRPCACSDTLYALTTTGFPPCHMHCVCVHKCFVSAPYSETSPPFPACVRPAERHPSFSGLLTTCISICWPQMSRRARGVAAFTESA